MKVRGTGHTATLRRSVAATAVASCFAYTHGLEPAHANPTGPVVKSGTVTFQQSGGVLQITNSPNAVIHWQGFSIDRGELTRFIQQNPQSAVLNRVTGASPSAILGALQSNGRVFLINPNGILFGAGSQVNVAGLVASSLNLTDADFLAGRLRFGPTLGAGAVVNEGAITTPGGGQVYLIAPSVQNSGVITTPKGEVIIAAGTTVEMADTKTPLLRVEVVAPANEAVNAGKIIAEGGRVSVYGTAIRNGGEINANTLVRGENGEILLRAKKDVTLEKGSVLTASGPSAGKISIQAESGTAQIAGRVEANAVPASPPAGGGVAQSAGVVGEKGGAIDIRAGREITVDAQALVTANGPGGGGTVTLNSTSGTTRIAGVIEAKALSSSPPAGGGVAQSAGVVGAGGAVAQSAGAVGAGGTLAITADKLSVPGNLKADGASGGQVTIQANSIAQSGTITADATAGKGGTVDVRAVDGIAQDTGAIVSASSISGDGGAITIAAGSAGRVVTSAALTVTGGGIGGAITVTAKEVELRESHVDASGDAGGGLIRLGGDYQGKGTLPNSRTLLVDRASRIRADARRTGNGGRVILWSDEHTRFLGEISARGGPLAGNGGFAEVSGKQVLQFSGLVDLRAPQGKAGTLLLDPTDINIVATGTTTPDTQLSGQTFQDSGAVPTSEITIAALTSALSNGDVIITTNNNDPGAGSAGDITWQSGANLNYNGLGTRTLTLNANNNITIAGNISDSNPGGDVLNLALNPGASGTKTISGLVALSGGTLTQSGSGNLNLSGTIQGATVVTTGGGVLASSSGTLNGVTIGSDLTTTNSGLTFVNGVTLANGITLSGGTNWSFSPGSQISTPGPGTATIVRSGGTIFGAAGGTGTLTIGSGVTLSGHTTISNSSAATLVNNGTINASDAGQTFTINTTAFTNNGTVNLTAGTGALTISPGTFTNAGTISISAGTFGIGNGTDWTNTGTINLSGGIWNMGGTITTAQLGGGHFVRSGGTVNLIGTLDNAGTTVDISSSGGLFGTGGLGSFSGTIAGGTLVSSGATLSSSSGTLNGVTIGSDLTTTNSGLTFVNGVTLANGITLSGGTNWSFSPGSQISTPGPGTATIVRSGGTIFGAAGGTGTLTIGSGVTLSGHTTISNSSAATLVNNGTINASDAGQTFTINTTAFTNNGTVNLTAGTGALTISPGTFTNAGTISISAGTFGIGNGTDWTNTGTINLSGGIWNMGGTITTAQLGGGHFVRSGGTVNLIGTLDNAGTTVDISSSGGLFGTGGLGSFSGTIAGGTLVSSGATLSSSSGTLNGVTIGSDLTTTNSGLTFVNGVTLANGITLSGGTNWSFSPGSQISTPGPGTATIVRSGGTIFGAAGGTGTLTIGSGVTLSGHTTISNSSAATLVNNGTINASDAGQTFTINTTAFTNNGTVNLTAGTGALTISPGTFTNAGTISISAGTFGIGNGTDWTNTGTINLSGGIWNMGGTITTAQLGGGHFVRSGGTVNLIGTLDNAGTTVDISSSGGLFGTGGLGSFSGTIAGGTLVSSGATLSSSSGTLNGVTIGSDLTTTNSGLTFVNGVTLANGITLSGGTNWSFSPGSQISTPGPGTATIVRSGGTIFGAAGGTGTLTIGSGVTLSGHTTISNSSAATLVNNGTINASDAGQTFTINTTAFTNNGTVNLTAGTGALTISPGTFTNAGTISISAGTFGIGNGTDWTNTGTINLSGGIWNMGGTITTAQLGGGHFVRSGGTVNLIGTLDNAGTTVDISSSGGLFGTGGLGSFSGTIAGGTLVSSGATLSSSSGTLNGVTIGSDLTTTNSGLTFVNGVTLANGITLSGGTNWSFSPGSQISTPGPGTATIVRSGGTIFGAAGGTGTLTIGSGVTLSGHTTISNSSAATLVNNGTINASDAGQTFTINTTAFTNNGTVNLTAGTGALTISPGTFTNAGTISISAGTFGIGNGTDWTNTGTINLSGGIWNMGGTITTAQLGGGHFVRSGGTVNLIGTLDNAGTTVDISSSGGLFGTGGLGSFSGTIAGGTLVSSGATLSSSSGTLNGVTIGSDLTTTNSGLTFVNGVTLANGITLSGGTNWSFSPGSQISTPGPGTATIVRSGGTIFGAAGGTGTLTIGSGVTLSGHTTISNSSAATLVNNGTINASDAGQTFTINTTGFANNGTVKVTGGGTFSTNSATFPSNAGVIEISAGSTFATSGAVGTTLTNLSSGTIRGNGTLTLGGAGRALTNSGTISPGSSPGTLHVSGDLVLTSSSVTSIEIANTGTAGVDYDLIAVTGTATLGGTLTVTHLNGFNPGVGASFQIMTYAARSGDFTTKTFPVAYNSTAGANSYGLDFGATVKQWINPNSGDWNNGANWSGGVVPTDTDDVTINQPGLLVITVQPGVAQKAFRVTSSEDLLLNGGTLTLGSGVSSVATTLTLSSGLLALSNNGSLTAGTLTMSGGTLSGAGSVAVTSAYNRTGGTFNIGGAASITQAVGNLSIANQITASGLALNTGGGTVSISSNVSLGGGNLVIGPATGATLNSGATITNATVTNPSGSGLLMPFNVSGTLDGVTLATNLSLTDAANLTLKNGLTLKDAAKITLNSAGNTTSLDFNGTQTLSHTGTGTAEVVFAGTSTANFVRPSAGTLTIGPGILIHSGAGGSTGTVGNTTVLALVNQGTIRADAAGKTITVTGSTVTNSVGGVWETAGGTFVLGGAWDNSAGTLLVSSGVLNLGGTFTTAQLGALQNTGGTTNLTGTLTNTGTTLALTATTGSINLTGGTILNGTVTGVGASLLMPFNVSGTLDGVTLATNLSLTDAANLTLKNGLTLKDAAKITLNSAGNTTSLDFNGTQTLSHTGTGTAEVVFAGTSTANFVRPSAGTLTIGPGILIHSGAGGSTGTVGNTTVLALVNQGTIRADAAGKTITVTGSTVTNSVGGVWETAGGTFVLGGAWDNSAGTLLVSSGVLNLGGTFTTAQLGALQNTGGTTNLTGTLTNTGTTLALTATTGSINLTGGTILNGTVTGVGASLLMPFNVSGTLDGVTLATNLSLTDAANLTLKNGLTLKDAAKITLNSAGNTTSLDFNGTQTLSHTGTGTAEVVFAGTSTANFVRPSAGTLTIGPGILIHSGAGGSTGTVGNTTVLALVNQGTIRADAAGKTITVTGSTVTNSVGGVWETAGGTFVLGGAWDNSAGTLLVSSGVLNLGGTFTTAQLGALQNTGGTTNLTGTLTNTGTTLALTATTGSINLTGGTILNGTVTGVGASLLMPFNVSGTLDGVTLATNLSLTDAANLTLKNGLTLKDAAKITLNSAGNTTSLDFNGTQTLSHTGTGTAEVVFAGTSTANFVRPSAGTLTIGPGILIHSGAGGSTGTVGNTTVLALVNQGTIRADAAGKTITVTGSTVTNSVGGVWETAGGTFVLGGAWDNSAGTLLVSSGVLNLGGTFTTAQLGALQNTGGTTNLTGTLTNTGTTLALTATTGSINLTGGTILNGTVTGVGASLLMPFNVSGTLDGVTLATNLSLTDAANLTLKNGLTLKDAAKITLNSAGNTTSLDFNGTQTLSHTGTGTAEVVFAGTSTANFVRPSAGTLTIGPGILIHSGAGGSTGTVGNTTVLALVNQGTIRADAAGKTITVTGSTVTNSVGGVWETAGGTFVLGGAWDNSAGTLLVSSGVLNLGGTFTTAQLGALQNTGGTTNLTGTLTNTGTTLALTATTGSINLTGGTILNGTVTGVGASLLMPFNVSGTLDGVTLATNLSLTDAANLTLRNGLTLKDAAKITLNSAGNTTSLDFNGTQTLSHTGTGTAEVVFAGTSTANFVRPSAGTLTIGPGILIHSGAGGSTGTVGNTTVLALVNQGTITADASGKTITLTGSTVTNSGTLSAQNGGMLSSGAGFTSNDGTIDIGSNSTFSTGGNPLINAGTGTIKGSGTLKLVNTGTTGVALTNQGTIAAGNSPGRLTINGDLVLTGTSQTNIEIANTGTAGVDYDLITVTGTATLGGTLNVTHLGTFTPVGAQAFDVMTYASRTGDFATKKVDGVNFPGAFGYSGTPNATFYQLTTGGATTNNWINPAGGDWNVNGNWSLNHVPTASELAIVNIGTADFTVTYANTGTQPTVGALQNAETLTFSGGTLALAGNSSSTGVINISGGTLTANGNLSASTLNLSNGALNGTGTVTISNSLTWSGGTLAMGGEAALTGIASTWSGGVLSGNLRVAPTGTLTLNGPGAKLFASGGSLLNQGTVNWTAGEINPANAGATTITNASGGVFDIQGDLVLRDPSDNDSGVMTLSFVNQPGAQLRRSVSTGTVQLGGRSGGAANDDFVFNLQNDGTVNALTGTARINLAGTTTSNGGSFVIANGAVVDYASGAHTFSGMSSSGAGVLRVSGDSVTYAGTSNMANLELTGGTMSTATGALANVDRLAMSGGTLAGTGQVSLTGSASTWSGGVLSGNLRVAPNGTLTLNGAGAKFFASGGTLLNQGTVNWTAGEINPANAGAATITNAAGGVFDIQGDLVLRDPSDNDSGVMTLSFVNQPGAQLRRSVSTGTVQLGGRSGGADNDNLNVNLQNDGTVNVLTGTLQINQFGTTTTNGGSFTIGSGAVIDFVSGTHPLGNMTSSGAGTLRVSGATLSANAGASVNVSNLSFESGLLTGSGEFLVTGSGSAWSGGVLSGNLRVASGGTLILNGAGAKFLASGGSLLNQGTVNWTAGEINPANAGATTITNASGGVFDIQGDLVLRDPSDNDSGVMTLSFVNQPGAQLRRSVSTGTVQLGGRSGGAANDDFVFNLQNDGTVNALTGTARINLAGTTTSNGGSFVIANGAVVDYASGAHTFSGMSSSGAGVLRVSGDSVTYAGTSNMANLELTGGTMSTATGALANVDRLAMSGGTLAGTGQVSLTGSASTWSGGVLSGNLRVAPNGTLTLNGAGAKFFASGGTLLNQGTVNWTAGEINPANAGAATITNATGGVFDIQGDLVLRDPSDNDSGVMTLAFVNQPGAQLRRSVSTGTVQVGGRSGGGANDDLLFNLQNDGTVNVLTGTLQVNQFGATTANGGTFQIASGALIDFVSGTHALGNLTSRGAGTWQISGATVSVNAGATVDAANLALNSGLLTGAGEMLITGSGSSWNGGSFNGNLRVASAGTLTLSGGNKTLLAGASLTNQGTVAWTAGSIVAVSTGTATIANAVGGVFDIRGDLAFTDPSDNDSGVLTLAFVNQPGAELRRSAGAGIAQLGGRTGGAANDDLRVNLQNDGTVNVLTGTLQINQFGATTANGGSFTIGSGAVIDFVSGTHPLGNMTSSGAGTLRVSGATLSPNAGASVNVSNLSFESGVLSGAGEILVTGSGSSWSGGVLSGNLRVASGGTLTLNGAGAKFFASGGTLLNQGTVNWTAGEINPANVGSATITNAAGGVFDIQGDLVLRDPSDNDSGVMTLSFVNQPGAQLRRSVSTGTVQLGGRSGGAANDDLVFNLQNDGTFNVATGTALLNLGGFASNTNNGSVAVGGGATLSTNGAALTNAGTGMITGTGTLSLAGATLTNNGTIAPGATTGTTTGTLTISGNLSQGATGKVDIEIGGTNAGEFDVLAVTGTHNMAAGTLNVTHVGGFTPNGGQTFDVMTYSARSGDFAVKNVDGASFPGLFGYTGTPNTTFYRLATSGVGANNWINPLGGDWNTASNWSLNEVPTATQLAIINIGTADFTVTYSNTGTQPTVGALQNAETLTFGGGTLTLAGNSSSTGILNVAGGTLAIGTTPGVNLSAHTLNLSSGAVSGTGNLTVTDSYSHTAGSIAMTGTLSAVSISQKTGSLAFGGPVTANQIAARAAGGISNTAALTTTGGKLLLSAGDALAGTPNPAATLTVGSALASGGGDITLQNTGSGGIGINANVNTGTGTVRLYAPAGQVTELSTITFTAGAVGVDAGDAVLLNGGFNNIGTIAGRTTLANAAFAVNSNSGMTVGSVSAADAFPVMNGISTVDGATTLLAGSGSLIISNTPAAIDLDIGRGFLSAQSTSVGVNNVLLVSSGAAVSAGAIVYGAPDIDLQAGSSTTAIGTNPIVPTSATVSLSFNPADRPIFVGTGGNAGGTAIGISSAEIATVTAATLGIGGTAWTQPIATDGPVNVPASINNGFGFVTGNANITVNHDVTLTAASLTLQSTGSGSVTGGGKLTVVGGAGGLFVRAGAGVDLSNQDSAYTIANVSNNNPGATGNIVLNVKVPGNVFEPFGTNSAPGGNITITNRTGGMFQSGGPLQTTGGGSITLNALGGSFSHNNPISSSGAGTLTINATGLTVGGTITGPGGVFLNAGTGTLTSLSDSTHQGIVTNGGGAAPVTITADSVALNTGGVAGPSQIFAGTGTLTIRPSTLARGISIAPSPTEGSTLALTTPTELATIQSMGTLEIGRADGTGLITFPGSPSLTFSTPVTAYRPSVSGASLTFNAPASFISPALASGTIAGSGALAISGTFDWSGGTITGSAGTLSTSGTTNITGTAPLFSRAWTNSGTVNVSGAGKLQLAAGASLTNQGTAVINLTGTDASPLGFVASAMTINNAGTINKTSTGTQSIDDQFNNTGTVNVNAGTLNLALSGTDTGSRYSVASGAALQFNSGLLHVADVAGGGNVNFAGGTIFLDTAFSLTGTTTISGASVQPQVPVTFGGPLTVSSGVLLGAASVTTNNAFTWSGGTFVGGTSLITAGTSTITTSTGGTGNWTNSGTATIANAGSVQLGAGSTFTNQAGGVLNLTGTATTPISTNGSARNIVNAGTINKDSTGTQDVGINLFSSSGRVNVNAGTLELATSGTDTGTYAVAGAAELKLPGGTRTFDVGSNFTGSGTVSFEGVIASINGSYSLGAASTTSISAGQVGVNAPVTFGGTLAVSGGQMTNSAAAITVSNAFNWSGGSLAGAGTLTTTGATGITGAVGMSSKPWNNTGTVTISGSGSFQQSAGATFSNQALGVINLTGTAATPIGHAAGVMQTFNAGTINKSGGAAQTIDNQFFNTGTVNVNGGTLAINAFAGNTSNGTLNVASGATLSTNSLPLANTGTAAVLMGSGTFDLGGATLTNNATIRPGTSPGKLTINGDLVLTGTSQTNIEIANTGAAGVDYDLIAVTGAATLGGTLNVTHTGGFTPSGVQTFNVMSYASGSGDFAAKKVDGVNFPGAFGYVGTPGGTFYQLATGGSAINQWQALTGDWGTTPGAPSSNWSLGHVPTASEVVLIPDVGTPGVSDTITVSATGQVAKSITNREILDITSGGLTFSEASTSTGTLRISNAAGTLTANGDLTAATLNLSAGTLNGSGVVTVNNALNWSGGTISTALATAAGAVAALSGGTKVLTSAWSNSGTVNWTGGALDLNGAAATLTNKSGGVFNANIANGAVDDMTGAGSFVNQAGATFNVPATATAFDVTIFPTFNNAGAVNVNATNLDFHGGGTHSGAFNIASGAAIRHRDNLARSYGAGSTVSGAGSFQVWDGATTFSGTTYAVGDTTVQDTGTLTLSGNATTGTLNHSAGTLSGSGVTVTGNWNYTTGASLDTVLTLGAATSTSLNGVTVTGAGSINNLGSLAIINGGTLSVALANSGSLAVTDSTLSALVTSSGSVAFGGANTVASGAGVSGGTVNFTSGTTTFPADGTYSNVGTTTVGSGATAGFDNLASTGTLNLSGGRLAGGGGLTVNGAWNYTAGNVDTTLTLASGSTSTLTGVTVTGTGSILNQGLLNLSDAIVDASVTNQGTLKTVAGTANRINAIGNAGTIELGAANDLTQLSSLSVPGALDSTGKIVFNNSGVIRGNGTLTVENAGTLIGNLVNDGWVMPGASPGTLVIQGNFVQSSIGNLEIEVEVDSAGKLFDVLDVRGTVSLAGNLFVRLSSGSTPASGDSVTIMQFKPGTGTQDFTNAVVPDGYTVSRAPNGTSYTITFFSTVAASPPLPAPTPATVQEIIEATTNPVVTEIANLSALAGPGAPGGSDTSPGGGLGATDPFFSTGTGESSTGFVGTSALVSPTGEGEQKQQAPGEQKQTSAAPAKPKKPPICQ